MGKIEKILLGIKKKHFFDMKRIRITDKLTPRQIQSRVRRRVWHYGYNEAMKAFNERVDTAIKRIKKLYAKKK